MIFVVLLLLAQGNGAADVRGEWINERQTVAVRVADCASGICGTVVWSTVSAQHDAERGGTAQLNGMVVMSGFRETKAGSWRGRLFLPDQHRTVRASLELRGSDRLQVKGCDLGGLVCRSQMWTRLVAN